MKKIKCRNNYGNYSEINQDKFVFRPSAYGVIVNKKREVLLLTNKGSGKLWFPGGGIEVGEKIIDGLKREIFEETGLKVKIGKLLLSKENFFYYEPLDEAYHAFLFFFKCEPLSSKIKLDNEIDDLESGKPRWYGISDLKKDDFGDLRKEVYEMLRSL